MQAEMFLLTHWCPLALAVTRSAVSIDSTLPMAGEVPTGIAAVPSLLPWSQRPHLDRGMPGLQRVAAHGVGGRLGSRQLTKTDRVHYLHSVQFTGFQIEIVPSCIRSSKGY